MGHFADLKEKEAAESSARALSYEWLTTAPNPHVFRGGPDAGQRGWRCHAVKATPDTKMKDLGRSSAACGLRPAHGWGMDLFVERQCMRCQRVLVRLSKNLTQAKS